MSSKRLFSVLIISERDYGAIRPLQIQEDKSNDFPESLVSICQQPFGCKACLFLQFSGLVFSQSPRV
jgi:hypothetical protein